ncbi:MAG: hypothetical protein L6R19_05720 [Alphaproteobacteria bacterium]|nr:hypothetical protein [Alphaproteobacteria bacterium]
MSILIAGFAWCALTSLLRLALLAYGMLLPDDAGLPLSDMVLTYMPVADAAFVGLFAWLIVAGLRPGTRGFIEATTMVCGIFVLYVVPYVFAFRHLTDTAAFSLAAWQTYVHFVVPVAFCLWALAYVNRSDRVRAAFPLDGGAGARPAAQRDAGPRPGLPRSWAGHQP